MRSTIDSADDAIRPAQEEVSLHDLMQEYCATADLTPPDYSSNPAHLDGFGR